jgi:Yip1 domain
MKNVLVCSSCSHQNPFYLLNCERCTAFLRPRNPNINLWETIWKLFDTPITTSEKIVQAEHKNFLIPFLIIITCKYSLVSMIFFNVLKYQGGKATDVQNNFFFGGLTVILLLIVFSFIITYINRFAGIKNRFKDNLSLYAYSFTPQIFAMLILIPVEFALFGEYWFTFNPSPFLIKPIAAYMLFAIETIMYLWTSMLFIMSTYAQTRNKIYSSIVGVSLSVLIILTLLFA